jgi:ribosome-binding ATPase YchF (GTP1/OBG family)
MWLFGILKKNWNKLIRKYLSEKLDFSKIIHEQFSGIGISLEDIIEAKRAVPGEYFKWEDEDIQEFLGALLRISKPMIIVANKADLPTAEENIKKLQEKYGNVIPASAESELALVKASEAGLINYVPGSCDFEIVNEEKLNDAQKKALTYIKEHVLDKYGSTGVQEALNRVIFDLLNMLVVYPVEDEHKMSDSKGNVLPDAILIRQGSNPRDLAFVIHTDIGESFMHAMDARSCRRVSSDYELKSGDIISIICR